ncbi:phosphoribosyltransferase [Paenibacillus sp. An7]|uniref:phosphoribosyltransferase n=1 Tax=Paenibacillus sp. An7 TaxID=2689577 RepID=UPI001356C74E|nr:phosphoribosyltransferase [Paenibacillus sp. An7]
MDIFFNKLILLILTVSTVLFILEVSGLLPQKISLWINRNKLTQTFELLKQLGIDVDRYKRASLELDTPTYFKKENLEEELRKELEKATLHENVGVGKITSQQSNTYIDVMSFSTNPVQAELYTRYLSTFWSRKLSERGAVRNASFDFIVTPKNGSPILGYEFAKLFKKPLALYNEEPKFSTGKNIFQKTFDFMGKEPKKGSVALLVDDSTTGGRKMVDAIDKLREQGYIVTDCLVLFEPTIKDARERLKRKDVELHSILKV